MLRSLLAIIVAVICGLTVSRFIEAGLTALFVPQSPSDQLYKVALLAGWTLGSFCAGAIALLIGRRWQPLGVLASATIGLNALITLPGAGLVFWMYPISLALIGLGAYAAMKLLRATSTPLESTQTQSQLLNDE